MALRNTVFSSHPDLYKSAIRTTTQIRSRKDSYLADTPIRTFVKISDLYHISMD
jgi:hypothetical protein